MAGKRNDGLIRRPALGIAGLLACVVAVFVVWQALSGGGKQSSYLDLMTGDSPTVTLDEEAVSRITAFCGDCHAVPRAESFVRDAWYTEVMLGYEHYARSERNDLEPPPVDQTVAYFRSRAPEQLVFPEPAEADTELRATFTVEKLTREENFRQPPAASHLGWIRLGPDEDRVLLACDMRTGRVVTVDLRDRKPRPEILARLNNPCHVEPCDLDGDGAVDLVVADLGSYFPGDHDRGRVVWLRRAGAMAAFEEIVIAFGLGRVADVRPADVDTDGDLDLIVAEFGHYRTGKIALLRNVAVGGDRPRFELEEIDPRPGTIHVPVDDFNRDGHADFMALVSQEYEHVEAFVNRGDGQFDRRILWTGPDLTFGSSGIELVDLDRDGDVDILYANGDAFDNGYVNPSHGVQWLENLGDLEFACHRLTDLTGAYRALAGDVDLDGDLDIIVSAFLPLQIRPSTVAPERLASILCLEQTEPGVFVRHTLDTGFPYYPVLQLADFDRDGDLDFAAGTHVLSNHVTTGQTTSHWLAVWWNQVIAGEKH